MFKLSDSLADPQPMTGAVRVHLYNRDPANAVLTGIGVHIGTVGKGTIK